MQILPPGLFLPMPHGLCLLGPGFDLHKDIFRNEARIGQVCIEPVRGLRLVKYDTGRHTLPSLQADHRIAKPTDVVGDLDDNALLKESAPDREPFDALASPGDLLFRVIDDTRRI